MVLQLPRVPPHRRVSFLLEARPQRRSHMALFLENKKIGSLFFLVRRFVEGELNPVANKSVSHLAKCLHFTFKSITPKVAMEMDKLSLDELYNRALKAS